MFLACERKPEFLQGEALRGEHAKLHTEKLKPEFSPVTLVSLFYYICKIF